MKRSEYITKCQAEVDDTSDRAKAVLETAFDDTYQEVLNRLNKFLIGEEEVSENTILGQRYIVTTNEAGKILRVWIKKGTQGYREMKRMSPKEYNPNTDSGQPSRFYVKGNRIYFDRTPDDSYLIKLQWIPRVENPACDDDVQYISDKDYALLIYGTVYRFMGYEEGGDMTYRDRYYNMLREIELREATKEPLITKNVY